MSTLDLHLGVKSDPILYRYSYDWLFALMERAGVHRLQLGTFFELYQLPDSWFLDLRSRAQDHGIEIGSVFTAHRELGGFFLDDPAMAEVAERSWRRLIEVAALLGARYAGANPGAVLRDKPETRGAGSRRYLDAMVRLSVYARTRGLEALTLEPMSCHAEPPSRPEEIRTYMEELEARCGGRIDAVPVYLCADISHGYADASGRVVDSNIALFESGIPWTCEFHLKNTDAMFNSTFGFTREDRERGIVDVGKFVDLVHREARRFPVKELTGYLEIGGPKLGRDYSDPLLGPWLEESLAWIRSCVEAEGQT